ncbi:LysR substrate binding domain-containing protein [Amycolatopsis australiensis]|uniref:LysR substrate binding domain-containing protein n=1 Tax=Amycolatopsis australiensis TaxID=546364 RepID=A0A1K1SKC1_9PSEU|nr:LysR substrate binding domain-containing protein [Amycolatopsis australiensis]
MLVLVDDLGSIGQAAGALGIAQPAASKRLSTLERQLGLSLVDRTRRGWAQTPDGRVIAGWAHRALAEVDGLRTGAEALLTQRGAQLRVAASITLAEHFVPAWTGEVKRTGPARGGELGAGRRPGGARPLLELGSASAVRNAVIAGAGPAVTNELDVVREVAGRRLAAVAVAGVELSRVLRAVWPAGRR